MARREVTLLSWIVETGEARLLQFAEELLANPKMAEAFSSALQRAVKTKGQVDRNMQMVLGLLNLPSKADYNRLLSKIEALQGSLVNLNIKVDRLLAERERPKPRRRPPAKSEPSPS
ncbi:MAG: hypothetical protein B6D46_09560 [Polyangiaceae bacterium UTPRO1]|jgi:hypothetical protein|nr:hypothetical protein [Myxococcales bacterium]OQY66694.1 MAG: hypothetical protein B6D46_09560 [Polyangiaceae bacterium UTPRO1]